MNRRDFLMLVGKAHAMLGFGLISSIICRPWPALSETTRADGASGIHLKFICDPGYVAWYSLSDVQSEYYLTKAKDNTDLIAFQNRAWTIDPMAANLISRRPSSASVIHSNFTDMGKREDALIQQMIEDESFKPVLEQTRAAASRAEQEWFGDYDKSFAAMKDITGIELNRTVNVYICHPAHRNGQNDRGEIFWSYRTDFPHYNTIYLWHELMHIILSDGADWQKTSSIAKGGRDDVEHAVIELCTDHELRKRLGGASYPPFIGHDELAKLERKFLPHWRKYLAAPNKDLRKFIASMNV